MPYFENSGAKLYFEETGCGNPLIFLHGALKIRAQRHRGQNKPVPLRVKFSW